MSSLLSIQGVSWTHLVSPTREQIEALSQEYDLHDLIIDDVLERTTQDKIDEYDDLTFIVLHFPKYNTQKRTYFANEFKIMIGKDFIISIAFHHTTHIEQIRKQFVEDIAEMEKDEKFKASPYYILYQMIDVLYDKTIKALRKFIADLNLIEEKIFANAKLDKALITQLLIKRRNAVVLKHMIRPQIDILSELQKLTLKLYGGELDVYIEDLESKLSKVISTIAVVNEMTNSLSETYSSLASIQTNTVVSVLTIFTLILGILTLIAGIYGMNVPLPGGHNPRAILIIIVAMIGIGIGIMEWAKRRGWR